ncbi:MAG TPA: transposase [Prolixibacteraceae bacterium]|nr:transposase [Prolixibacteraceae bacterium]
MGLIFNKDISEAAIEELFVSDEKCMEFLADLKWADGFTCRKCGNTNFCAGKSSYSRRCTKCKSEESAASGTIFHNCKFPIHKAFVIAYNVCKGKEDVSTYEFARRLALRQMTCWNFKTKIQSALKSIDTLTNTEKVAIEKMLGS